MFSLHLPKQLCSFSAAQSQIFGSGNLTADYGGDAYYACAVANPTGAVVFYF